MRPQKRMAACAFHKEWGLATAVHVDDSNVTRTTEHIEEFCTSLEKKALLVLFAHHPLESPVASPKLRRAA